MYIQFGLFFWLIWIISSWFDDVWIYLVKFGGCLSNSFDIWISLVGFGNCLVNFGSILVNPDSSNSFRRFGLIWVDPNLGNFW